MHLTEENIKRFWKYIEICDHGIECRTCHWIWKSHTRGVDKKPSFTIFESDENGVPNFETGKRYQFYATRIMYFLIYGTDDSYVFKHM